MALIDKIETTVEIKASADKFYKLFSNEAQNVPNASDSVHEVDVHEGDWETDGSVKLWKYTVDGETEVFKEKVQLDEASKSITFNTVEGHVLEQYKSYKVIFQALPMGTGGGLVKIIIEFENFKAEDPSPDKYLGLLINVVKDVDAHLAQA